MVASVQERPDSMSPGHFESIFVKAADSETKGRLGVQELTAGSLGTMLGLPPKKKL